MNKKDYLVDYINSLLIPFVCLLYSDIEINNIVNFRNKIKSNSDNEIIKSGVIDYIKDITWNLHDLYNFYFNDYKITNVYTFILLNYDFNSMTFRKKDVELKLLKILDFVQFLLKDNITDFKDFIEFKKQINWIFKVIPLKIKENIYEQYYPKSYNKLYDYDITTNVITSFIIEQCTKLYDYKPFNIWNVDLNTKITNHDKKLINPILVYIKENPSCVNIEEFTKTRNNQMSFKINNDNTIIDLTRFIKNKDKSNIDYKLKKFINFNIGNLELKLTWVCYLNSVLYLFIFIPEFRHFILSNDVLNYVKKKNIKYSVLEGLYNKDNNIVANKLKSKYPYKYNFLGFNQIIIQPYIIFIDLLNIITEEINSKSFIDLFVFTNKKRKHKIIKHIKNKSFKNTMFQNYISNYVKDVNEYIVFSFDNYMFSIDKTNFNTNSINLSNNEYPIIITLNKHNELYKLEYCILCRQHHYEFVVFNDTLKYTKDLIKENNTTNNMNGWMIHMLIYKRCKK